MWLALKSKEYLSNVFSRNAEAYQRRLEESMRKGQAAGRDALLDHVRARPGMRVLDLCCGPGTLTIPLARDLNGTGEVVGVDDLRRDAGDRPQSGRRPQPTAPLPPHGR